MIKHAPVRYLVEDIDRHGNIRLYVRVPGKPKVRLRETTIGTPEFWAAYHAALQATPAPKPQPKRATPGSFRALCLEYFKAAEYTRLSERTRYVRKRVLDKIAETDGDKPYRFMEARHVRKRRDAAADRPEAANEMVKTLRQLFAWAIEAEHAKVNPARDVPYIRTGSEGFHTWTVEEVEKYREFHAIGTKARLAMDLMLFTGTRKSDAIRLGPQMMRDGWIRWTEVKGRSKLVKNRELPILPELAASIAATKCGHLNFLVTEFGKPYTAGGFGNWFRRRCDDAGLPHCTAHGLRKAGATIAADNGATEHQLMAIYGWESPKQAAHYTKKANRKRLAGDAMHLIRPRTEGNESVPPSGAEQASGTKATTKLKEIK
jgi:integrase